jgi:outer membrane protein assembly factor BamB
MHGRWLLVPQRVVEGSALLMVSSAAYLGLRTPVWGKFDPLPAGVPWFIGYLATVLLVTVILRHVARRGRRLPRLIAAATAVMATALLVGMVEARVALAHRVSQQADPWPPHLAEARAVLLDTLPAGRRAEWALRVGSHRLVERGQFVEPITVPSSWPFPTDAELAVVHIDSTTVDLWARAGGPDSKAACQSIVLRDVDPADSAGRRQRCDGRHDVPATLTFLRPPRVPDPVAPVPDGPRAESWSQYRHDAGRSGIDPEPPSTGDAAATGWRAVVDGQVRASVSVAGDVVLVGAHGTGSLTALDRRTGAQRWVVRVPNWIHQDAASDGRTVVVGFGDNLASFAGRLPSGVAAYDLESGTHLWTAFDAGSVMTTPVILDSVIIYGTGAGLLRKRRLATGDLMGERVLPGMVTMAPPVLIGDTVVFTLDYGTTCAIDATTLDALWCRTLHDLRMLGHAGPAIAGDEVIISGAATVASPTLGEFLSLPRGLDFTLVRSALFPGQYEAYAGQVFVGLDLHDGHVRWRSPLFANPHLVPGHTSGTAVVDDALAAIVLPLADTVVAFDIATGRIRWARPAHGARGPVLVVAHHVVLAGRDGIVQVRDIVDGTLTCTLNRATGWDRAGPVLEGGLAVFVNLVGEVEAMPLAQLLNCGGDVDRPEG